ncbi:MAG TPA: CorA family divalent cation transporter [Verrucomicrobiae bacterium]
MIIPANWKLPDSIKTRLGQASYGRQRAIIEEGHVLVVLHRPPDSEQSHREGVLYWRSPAGEWQTSVGGPGMGVLKTHVQMYADLEAKLAKDYDHAMSAGELFDLIETLTPLSRAARNMHQALQNAREAVKGDTAMIDVRDLAYEVDRNLDILLQDVRNAIDYKIARESEEQARLSKEALHASHRLNMLAALFLPLTAITSLFGMNFHTGWESNSPLMFWLALGAGIGLGVLMMSWVLSGPGDRRER